MPNWLIRLGCVLGFLAALNALLARRVREDSQPNVVTFGTREQRIRRRLRDSREIALGALLLIIGLVVVLWFHG